MHRHALPALLICAFVVSLTATITRAAGDNLDTRRAAYLAAFAKRDLPAEQNPLSWVDTERWCIAHAAMTQNVRIDEANHYLATVAPVSLSRGLVADTGVQATDLLRTYLTFKNDKRLSPGARKHIESFLRDWRVPNHDRNRDADLRYEWPSEYTENHTLNILAASYLIDHAMARDSTLHRRLMERFLADRAALGWAEMSSPQYALVTAKALTLLVDFAPDENIATAARMLLDIQAIEFANHGLRHWRGVPFVRGAGMETSNLNNAYFELARFWFGDRDNAVYQDGHPFLVHVLASKYVPPAIAQDMLQNPEKRGRYTMHSTGTTGAARLRIPVTHYISPTATMTSAQGYGSYYRGCYWSISFASHPNNVVTGSYDASRNILQVDNVMATFGSVNWFGSLGPATEGNITVGTDGAAYLGQIAVTPTCHLLFLADKSQYPTPGAFRTALLALKPALTDDGTLTWTQPDGRAIRMTNTRDGHRWRIVAATANDQPLTLDSNMRFDSPHLRSVRGSGVIESLWNGQKTTYDFSDMTRPQTKRGAGALTAIAPARLAGDLGIEFIHIPPAEFPMGSPVGEGRSDEQPMRWVTLDGFCISKTEVTVGQWKQYLAANPAATKPPDWFYPEWGKTDNHAMTWVSWDEARAFCDWLTKKTGKRHALPTEAQWEKAAKGYAHRAYPWGNDYDGSQSGTPNEMYNPVASKPTDVSPFGVLDMAGNAWEWCADWYAADAYSNTLTHNPTGPATGTLRAIRGCGWNYDPETFRAAFRTRLEPEARSIHIGFRVAREE